MSYNFQLKLAHQRFASVIPVSQLAAIWRGVIPNSLPLICTRLTVWLRHLFWMMTTLTARCVSHMSGSYTPEWFPECYRTYAPLATQTSGLGNGKLVGLPWGEFFRRKICLFVKWDDEFECSTNFSEIIIWWRWMKSKFVKLTFPEIQPTLNELYQPKLTQLNYNCKQYCVPQKVWLSDGRGLFLGIHSGYKEGS